mmetsp:Transcript_35734/g.73056  ORF Transcript_35734/g.73056 Transcript_35734/m.73056 type:complete len:223 (-) Transcript_35734:472-1140(-)
MKRTSSSLLQCERRTTMRSLGPRLLAVGVVASICHLSFYFSIFSGGESSNSNSNSNSGAVEVMSKDPNGIIDTAIIITSSWIPSHPSTLMVEMVVNSIDLMITSLHPSTPIFITIDQFRLDGDIEQIQNRSHSLDQHVLNLYNIYLINPRVLFYHLWRIHMLGDQWLKRWISLKGISLRLGIYTICNMTITSSRRLITLLSSMQWRHMIASTMYSSEMKICL